MVWKTERRPLLGLFLQGAGFGDDGEPALGVISGMTPAEARTAFGDFAGPILLLDAAAAEPAADGVIRVTSPYSLLTLHHELTGALAPKPPPEPAKVEEEKKPAPDAHPKKK